MSRRMTMSPKSPKTSKSRRSAAAALALGLALSLAACGGDDNTDSAAQEDTAATSTDAGAAAGAVDESQPHEHAEGEEHDDAAAAGDDHAHTPGMDMSGQGEGEMKDFATLEKEAAIPASKPFNFQDVYFLQHMIAHHAQAVDMAEMVLEKSKNPAVRKLGTAIHEAQAPEIEQMTKWLEDWDQSTENAPHAHDPNAPSAGMMTEDDMSKLHAAKGDEFDKTFLKQMIFHHEGAVNQSKTELENGEFKPAKKLAKAIIDAQTKEIAKMKAMLKKI